MGYIKWVFFILITVRCFGNIPLVSIEQSWHHDINRAQEIAKEQNRPLLIAFLGPYSTSEKLEEEILTSRKFLSALNNQVIFLRVDIAENGEQELMEKYGVDQCPTLVLVEPSGQQIAKLESLPVDVKEYVGYIKEVLSDYSKITDLAQKKSWGYLEGDELKALYTQAGKFADASFKKILLDQGLKTDRQSPYFLIEQYGRLLAEGGGSSRQLRHMRNQIIARDVNNEEGYIRRLALMDFEALTNVENPKRAGLVVKPLVDYLQKFGAKDLEYAWEIEMKISQYLFSKDQFQEALKHANASLKVAPEPKQREIAKSIQYLQTFMQ